MKRSWIIVLILIMCLAILYLIIRKPIAVKQNDRGMLMFDSTEYIQAEKHFARALTWDGNYYQALINLVKCELIMERTDEARSNLERLKDKFPELAETLALEGEIMVLDKNYLKAVEKLSLAIKRDSLLASAYFYRGIALANLGKLEEAASDYLKAQQIDRTNMEALKEGAILFSKLENFEAAIENYTIILELDPSNTDAYLKRADFKQRIKDLGGAISDYDNVIRLNPEYAVAYFNRGKCYAQREDYSKAIADFIESASMKYKIASSKYNAGLASFKINKLNDARRYLEESIAADKEKEQLSKSLHLLGVLHMMNRENSKALDFFTQSIEVDKNFADAYYNRGIAYGILEKYELALNDLEKALELGYSSPDLFFAIGVQKINLRKTEEGCKALAKAAGMGHIQAANMQRKYCKNYMK